MNTFQYKEKRHNNYSDRTAERIERGREQKQKGTLTTITPENIWTLTNKQPLNQ